MPRMFATDIVEISTTLGIGTYTMDGARDGYRSFDEGFDNGDTPYYVVRNAADNKYEHNRRGVFSSGVNTLTRNTYLSSNGNAPVSWVSEDHPLLVYVPSATEIFDDIVNGFRGGTRSVWLNSGFWVRSDFPSAGIDTVMYFDGTNDIPYGQIEDGDFASITVQLLQAEIHKWVVEGNPLNQKKWQAYVDGTGKLVFGAQSDDESTETTLKFNRDGTVTLVAPAGDDNSATAATTAWVRTLATLLGPKTGDLKSTHSLSGESGWILWSDGTIGDGASGATIRANSDTANLYAVYWGYSNTICPVTGGRGANAAADFAAHKPIQLPPGPGRVIGVAGTGTGLTARIPGETLGAETHVHSGTTGAPDEGVGRGDQGGGITVATVTHHHVITVDARSSYQPTTFANTLIKL